MGNEMGNNNVSGLQEEKARTEEDQGKFLQDENHVDELKGENRAKLEAEEKDIHEKQKLNENGEATDFHEVLVPSETLLADLIVEETSEENESSDGNEEHNTVLKPPSVPVEIPPISNDADFKSEEQEVTSLDFLEKTDLNGNCLTTADHGSKEEMLIGKDYIEAKNRTAESKAGLSERDPNPDQQEVVQAEEVAEGINIPQSENGHSVSNKVAENMYLCVIPETGNQTVATGMITVESKADEDELNKLFPEDETDVFIPEEVDTCFGNEHNVDQSPLNVLQLPQDAPESAVEASYQQLGVMNSPLVASEAPKDTLNSPLDTLEPRPEDLESALEASHPQPQAQALLKKASDSPLEESEAPVDALNPTKETSDPPLEAPVSPLETSDPQPLALDLIVKASDPSLEAANSQLEASEPSIETSESPSEDLDPGVEDSKSRLEARLEASELPLEALDSPLEAPESQLEAFPQASSINSSEVYAVHGKTINVEEAIPTQLLTLELIVKASDPSLEALNSQLEASEPSIETSNSPSEDSDPPVEASKPRLETQFEATDSPLEVSESQLEAFPQASLINSSHNVFEPHDKTINVKEAIPITSEGQNGETKLANDQVQSSEEKDQNFETFVSKASQSEQMCGGSNCNKNDREIALASSVEKNCVVIESDMHNDKPQVAFLNQTLKPCIEEQPAVEEIMLLTEESKPIESEVEIKENKGDYIKTQFCDQELKGPKTDDVIASQLEFLASETDYKKSSEQSAHEFDSTNGIAQNCQLEDLEVKCNEDQVAFADTSLKLDSNEVADTMSEIEAVSAASIETEYKHDEEKPEEEIGDKEKETLLENDTDRGDIIGMSQNSDNRAKDVSPYFLHSEAFKDKNELIRDSKSEFLIVSESFQTSPSVAILQSMTPTPEQEAEQNIQETSVMAETSSLLFNEQSAKGQETVEKLMNEPSSDTASNHVEFRTSPSFHFDLSTDTKCEESDRSPLLCHDKTAGTSLISRDEAMIQKDNVRSVYNAPQEEVEEKTIRMERSDSERLSAPFLSFLQKEESAEILVAPEKQEKIAADKKTRKDPWTVIHKTFALTSPRDSNGKRKAKSSIFSTCICCASKTP